MDWKLIFSLSIFGLAMGIVSVLGFAPPSLEWLYWLVIAIIYATVIAKKVSGKLFLHGFFTGLIGGVIAPVIMAVFFSTYLANNPSYEQTERMPGGLSPQVFQFLLAPLIAVFWGLFVGVLTWLAGKIFKKQATVSATN